MSMQVKKKFIIADAVDESKLKFLNDGAFRARNAADSADVSLFKLDSSDIFKVLQRPRMDSGAAAASADDDLITKKYSDDAIYNNVTVKLAAANGIATLDASGKLPSSQLTIDAFEYKGTWSAATNTPSLADGTGNKGDVYQCIAAGSVDFGAGAIAFASGDKAVYNGSVWEKWDMSDSVDSVNGYTGVVVLAASDIDYTQAAPADWTLADGSAISATLDEVGSRLVALEGASIEHVQEKFTLASGDLSAGYIDLANLAISASINAFVDRLAIHQTDDYTLSVVGGVTRLTFVNSLVTPGQEQLAVGDIIHVKYAKKAI